MVRYYDYASLTATSGVPATYVLSTNGLYDPDITGTGHQPAGFDQMMLSYNHYTATRAKLYCTFHNTSTATTPTCALSVNASSTPVTNIDQMIEDGAIVTDRLMGANVYGAVRRLNTSCNVGKFGGVPNIRDRPDYQGDVATNPTEQSYFHIQVWGSEAATSIVTIEFMIEYEAWFTEPRKLSESLRNSFSALLLSDSRSDEKERCRSRIAAQDAKRSMR